MQFQTNWHQFYESVERNEPNFFVSYISVLFRIISNSLNENGQFPIWNKQTIAITIFLSARRISFFDSFGIFITFFFNFPSFFRWITNVHPLSYEMLKLSFLQKTWLHLPTIPINQESIEFYPKYLFFSFLLCICYFSISNSRLCVPSFNAKIINSKSYFQFYMIKLIWENISKSKQFFLDK